MQNDEYINQVRTKVDTFLTKHEKDIELPAKFAASLDLAWQTFTGRSDLEPSKGISNPTSSIIVLVFSTLIFGLPLYFLFKTF